jgi:predicted porin
LTVWRIAAQQEWTDKWTTFLYYANYNFDSIDADIKQYGLGVTYQLNPAVILGLAYNKFDLDDFGVNDQSTIRFRTQVSF